MNRVCEVKVQLKRPGLFLGGMYLGYYHAWKYMGVSVYLEWPRNAAGNECLVCVYTAAVSSPSPSSIFPCLVC